MFNSINRDWDVLTKERFATKYIIYLFIILLSLVLLGQIAAQLFPIRQLNRVEGRLIAKEFKVMGYTSGTRWGGGSPIYSLVLKLDNKQDYNVELNSSNGDMDSFLKIGDKITLYCPSTLYQIVSLDGLDFVSHVSQVDLNNNVLYSFEDQKRAAWKFIALLTLGILLFFYFLNDWYKFNRQQQAEQSTNETK